MNQPLLKLDLSPRVAEVLLWVAQGKSNAGISESTVRQTLLEISPNLGGETRRAAPLRALEVLSSPHSTAK